MKKMRFVYTLLVAGILVIAFSTVLIGLGNYLQGSIGSH